MNPLLCPSPTEAADPGASFSKPNQQTGPWLCSGVAELWGREVQGVFPPLNTTLSWCFTNPTASLMPAPLPAFPFSQKDLENLKAEVQRRQQLQESMKSGEQVEAEDKAVEEKEAEPSMPSAAIPLTQSSA